MRGTSDERHCRLPHHPTQLAGLNDQAGTGVGYECIAAVAERLHRLTARETEVLALMAEGRSNLAIAYLLTDFFTFSDGLIIGNWVGIDWLGLFVQLGVVSDPWAG